MVAEDINQAAAVAPAYLATLGLEAGPPTVALLGEITRRHVATFSFASIGVRLGDDLPIDPPSLLDRVVVRRRGGYCFEQNGLLFEVLRELGYDVHLQMARVVLNQDVHPGLTHRVSRVRLDGREYLVDVGFGPMGPPHPVPMFAGTTEPYWVEESTPGQFRLRTRQDDDWFTLYRFDAAPYGQSDAELGHFYSHRHPAAAFVNNLVASRILDDEVRSLRNRDYWVIRPTGTTQEHITDADRLHALLVDELALDVAPDESTRLWSELPPE